MKQKEFISKINECTKYISQKDICKKLNISKTTWEQWNIGSNLPSESKYDLIVDTIVCMEIDKLKEQNFVIHLEAGKIGMMGIVSHSYRQAACGARAERWLTTSNTDWPKAKYVNCKRCLRTKLYKERIAAEND